MQGKNATDALLAESFKELALRRPIEKITVKEITDRAGVIRPTFYNHFQDKYELLEWIILTELLENAADKMTKFPWLTPDRVAEYYAQSMCSIVIVWLKSGMSVSAQKLVEIYGYMMEHSITEVLFG